jgi:hypothetical protein
MDPESLDPPETPHPHVDSDEGSVGTQLPHQHSVHIIVASEDTENALMLFPAEAVTATADDRAVADSRGSDSSSSLIEIQHHPPIAGDALGVRRPLPGRATSTSNFENWSGVRRAQWLFGTAPPTRVWASAALLSVAALVVLVFALGRGQSDTAATNRSTRAATAARPPVVNPPRNVPRVAETPPAPALEARASFSTLPASVPSQNSSKAAPSPRSSSPEIDLPQPGRDDPRPTETTVPEIPAAAALPTTSEAPSAPPPAPRPEATGGTLPGRPVAASAIPVVITSDTDAIQNVLGRYLTAFMNLDVEEAKVVWPGVNARGLSRAFAGLDEQQFELNECEIAVAGSNADASCNGVVRYVPKVGGKTMRVERRQWKFELRNRDSQWLIENVDTR